MDHDITIEQLGGMRSLVAMMRARNFEVTDTSLRFTFSGNREMNLCEIELTPDDLYTLRFGKQRMGGSNATRFNTGVFQNEQSDQWVSITEFVYGDQLQDAFQAVTGLYTRL